MKRCLILPCFALLFLTLLLHGSRASGQRNSPSHSLSTETYDDRPLSFEPNRGQANSQVTFLSHGGDYTLFLTSHEVVFATLPRPSTTSPTHTQTGASQRARRTRPTPPDTVRMRLVGANPEVAPIAADLLPGHTNYLTGSDPTRWRTHIPNYAKVAYPEVYPDIDLVYYGKQHRLEYDFILRPHADPNAIGVRFAGAKGVRVDKSGALHIRMSHGEMVWHRPVLYQDGNGERREIAGGYRLCRDSAPGHGRTPLVRFAVGAYDPALPLVIDPSIAYSTFLGGSQNDVGRAITVDGAGNAYVTGTTLSADFPTTAGTQQPIYGGTDLIGNVQGWGDAFVTKLDHFGQVVFSTYIGGSGSDSANGIALSGSTICIAGATSSPNFPLTASAYQANPPNGTGNTSAFVTALTSDGAALAYSTYLGNVPLPGHGAGNTAYDIAADNLGKLYIAGYSDGNFPVTAGAYKTTGSQNAFIAKLDITRSGAASLVYGTFLGGSIGLDPVNIANKIAVDSSGNAYVVGITYCSDFPTTPGAFNTQNTQWPSPTGFVTKMNPTGTALVYSTFLPGANINGIAVDGLQYAYVTGSAGPTFPTTAGAFQTTTNGSSAFITRFNVAGSALLYSTFLGNNASGAAIAVEQRDSYVYVVGHVNATDFPTTPGAASKTFGGAGSDNYGDAFLTKMDLVGSTLLYSTYLGGAGDDSAYGVALDSENIAYLTGITGAHTGAPNFPTTNQTLFGGGSYDAFVTRISTARPQSLGTDVTFNPDGTINPFVLRGALGFDGITSPSEFGLLSSSNPAAASVPASVNVPETQFGLFPINLHPVTVDTSVTISATSEGVTLTVSITVLAPHIASVAFLPSSVLGGTSTNGTVTLSIPAPTGGLAITLTSSDPVVTVPSPITVPAGASSVSFLANTRAVAVVTPVTVTATSAGDTTGKSGNLTVNPPDLSSLTLAPTSVKGGQTSTGTVTISGSAPTGGIAVNLSSGNNAVATVPASVTVPSGAKTATFVINTVVVPSNTGVAITAGLNAGIHSATLTVTPPTLTSVNLNPTSVKGSLTSTGTVTISDPAPTAGILVTLSSNNTAVATVPASVTVPAGAKTATFTVTTTPVSTDTPVVLTAAIGASNATGTLTVQAPLVATLAVNPLAVRSFQSAVVTITLDGPAPAGGIVVNLFSSNTAVAALPAMVTVAAGAKTATAPVSTFYVASDTTLLFAATLGTSNQSVHFTVQPSLALTTFYWRNDVSGENNFWQLTGTTIVNLGQMQTVSDLNWKIGTAADLFHQGNTDLIWRSDLTGDIVYWDVKNGALVSSGYIQTIADHNWKIVGSADLFHKGNTDLIWQNSSSGDIVYWDMSGAAIAGSGYIKTLADLNWKIVATADLFHTGNTDLIFQNTATGDIVYWDLAGAVIASSGYISTLHDLNWRIAGSADLFGLSHTDLIWQNSSTGDVVYWDLTGSTLTGTGYIYTVPNLQWKIRAIR